jgi:hypothetical protein
MSLDCRVSLLVWREEEKEAERAQLGLKLGVSPSS